MYLASLNMCNKQKESNVLRRNHLRQNRFLLLSQVFQILDLTSKINQGQSLANSSCLLVSIRDVSYSTKSDMILILNSVNLELNDVVNLLMN